MKVEIWEFPRGTFGGVSHNKDYCILGSVLWSPHANHHVSSSNSKLRSWGERDIHLQQLNLHGMSNAWPQQP